MKLIEQIKKDFITAFKNKEMLKKDLLGTIKTRIVLFEKEKGEVKDTDIINMITSEIKKIKNTIESVGKESDLYKNALKEYDILKTYLPEQLEDSKVIEIVTEYIKENNLTKADFGRLMGNFSKELKGKFDNSKLKDIISEILK